MKPIHLTFLCFAIGGSAVVYDWAPEPFAGFLGLAWFASTLILLGAIGTYFEGPSCGGGGKAGTVYVIQDTSTGLYKIGRTTNLKRRMRELGVAKTARLIETKEVNDAAAVEKAAHKRYKDSRLPQTEYFKLGSRPRI